MKSNLKNLLVTILMMSPAIFANAQFTPQDEDSKYATELLKPGTEAPNYKLKDINGKKVQLAKLFKGSYTVVDFWASWCPDCRKDMPNVQRIFHEFAPKGVNFVGVSFDTEQENWRKAVEQYGIEYTQVSELKRMRDSELANAYGVKWIPSMMLLDPEGKVVLSTVLSDKLEKTLTEVMAANEPKVDTHSERLTIDGSKGALSAIIQKPELKQGEKCPMVIICHGFSGNKNEQMLQLLADSLQRRGIASIRFDFNGHGESEGDFVEMTVPNEIEDAQKVYEYVRDIRYVSDLAIVGHSQGGVVASMLAGKAEPEDFKAVVLMAPAAVLRDDAIRGNTMGVNYNPLDPPEYVELFGGGLRLGREYIKTAFSLPIYPTAAKYQGDAMIIHGTADRVVPYTYGERYHEIWPKSELIVLEGFDHGFSQNVYRAVHLATDFLVKKLK